VWRAPEGYADHTSTIATLLRRRGLPPLTERDAGAADLLGALANEPDFTADAECVAAVASWLESTSEQTVTAEEIEHMVGRPGRDLIEAPLNAESTGSLGEELTMPILAERPGQQPGATDVPLEAALMQLARVLRLLAVAL